MTVVYSTFDCSHCGTKNVKEIAGQDTHVYKQYADGAVEKHQACNRCRQHIRQHNNTQQQAAPKPEARIGLAAKPPAPEPSQFESALAQIGSALTLLVQQNQQILERLEPPKPQPEPVTAPSRPIPSSWIDEDDYGDGKPADD